MMRILERRVKDKAKIYQIVQEVKDQNQSQIQMQIKAAWDRISSEDWVVQICSEINKEDL